MKLEGNRINYVTAMIGGRGTGKTTLTKGIIARYRANRPDMKILIVDEIDHPAYRDIPIISPGMVPRWKGVNLYRLIGQADLLFPVISKYSYNTFLIFEDASVYMEGRLEHDAKRFVISSKARNLDILFQFHGFPEIPPRLSRYMDALIIFKCSTPEYRKKEIIEYEKVKKAWDEVMKAKSPYFYKHVILK